MVIDDHNTYADDHDTDADDHDADADNHNYHSYLVTLGRLRGIMIPLVITHNDNKVTLLFFRGLSYPLGKALWRAILSSYRM